MLPIRDHNPSGSKPYVTYFLMAANILVFLWTWQLGSDPDAQQALYEDYALVPRLVSTGHGYWGFVTSMFLHGGLLHLGGNMLFLFIFGDNVEDAFGHLGYLLFYLVCGVAAALAQFVSEPFSIIPMVGASGAIAGVMGAYLLLYPRAKVDILIILIVINRILPVPAWILLSLWFGMQLFGGFSTPSDVGGTAYWAHAGGFVAGLLLALPAWIKLGGPDYWSRTSGRPATPEAVYHLATRMPRIAAKAPNVRRNPGIRDPWSGGK